MEQTVQQIIPSNWSIQGNPVNFKIIFPSQVDGINGFSISKMGQELKCYNWQAGCVNVDVTCQLIGWTDVWDTLKFASDTNILYDFLREKVPMIQKALEDASVEDVNSSSDSE